MFEVTLILLVVMGDGQPRTQQMTMPTIESCTEVVKDFLAIDMKTKGFKVIGASCMVEDVSVPAKNPR